MTCLDLNLAVGVVLWQCGIKVVRFRSIQAIAIDVGDGSTASVDIDHTAFLDVGEKISKDIHGEVVFDASLSKFGLVKDVEQIE